MSGRHPGAGNGERGSPKGPATAGAASGRAGVIVKDAFHPKLPVDFVLHSLRHTFAIRLRESGGDAFTIMRLMGHSSITVSQRYAHPSRGSVELAFARLDSLNLQRASTFSTTVEEPQAGFVQ